MENCSQNAYKNAYYYDLFILLFNFYFSIVYGCKISKKLKFKAIIISSLCIKNKRKIFKIHLNYIYYVEYISIVVVSYIFSLLRMYNLF